MKEITKLLGRTFVVVTTFSLLATALFISFFYPGEEFHVNILWQILAISFLTSLTSLVFCSNRTISKKEVLVRMFLQMLMVLIILVSCAFCFEWVSLSRISLLLAFVLLVIIVYLVIFSLLYFSEAKNAEKINQKLYELQQDDSED